MSSTATTEPGRIGEAIWGRVIRPDDPSLTPEAARAILKLEFAREDRDRATALMELNQDGALTPTQRWELDELVRADVVLSLFKSKARLSLKQAGLDP